LLFIELIAMLPRCCVLFPKEEKKRKKEKKEKYTNLAGQQFV